MEDTNHEEIIDKLKPKRYAVTRQSYIWASDIIEAEKIAQAKAEMENLEEDNKCIVSSVVLSEFGQV